MTKTAAPLNNVVELATEFVNDAFQKASTTFAAQPGAAKENLEALNAVASKAQAQISEIQLKGVEIAEKQTAAAFNFLRDVVSAKSPETLVSLQQEFVKAQSETVMRHAQELNALAMGFVRELAAPVQDSFNKSFAQFSKKA